MAYTLLYISKTLLEFPAGEAEVGDIVAVSRSRNAGLDVTGVLISTGTYFAQMLEGPRAAVEILMLSIDADHRHMRVKTIRMAEEERRFSGWSMAYSGTASYVDRQIAPLFSPLSASDTAHLALRLIALMEEFVRLPSA